MIRRYSAALLTAVQVEKRSKHVPGSDKVSQSKSIRGVFINLLVLLREDFLLVPGVGPWLPNLWIMPSKNAENRCYVLICPHNST
jgi:hypothetical protein